MIKSSWRTSSLGIISIISAVCGAATLLLDGVPTTNPDWTTVIASIMAGVGLITARDNQVSSEMAGIKTVEK